MREKATELRHFIYLMNLTEDDIANVKVLLSKYEQAYFDSGPNNLQLLRFGADIMRTCHLLQEPAVALNVSKRWLYTTIQCTAVFACACVVCLVSCVSRN